MVENSTPIEFAGIAQAYRRHLRNGEPPNLQDLVDGVDPEHKEPLIDLVLEIFMETGQVGSFPRIPDLRERMLRFEADLGKLSDLRPVTERWFRKEFLRRPLKSTTI